MEKKKIKVPPVKPVPVVQKINHRVMVCICAFFALALYANTLQHEYVVDDDQVLENNKMTTQGISGIPLIVKSAYRAGYWDRQEGVYRPLSVVMFAIEWELAPNEPMLGHLMNILLYALTAFLLYRLMRKILHKHHPWIPFFITLLYIVMPVHTEVVANIKSRDEILCFIFALVSLQQLYNWLNTKKIYSLLFSLLAFSLALFSKETAITLLAVYPLFAYFFAVDKEKKTVVITCSYLAVAVIFMGIRYAVLGMMTGTDIPLSNNSMVIIADRFLQFATAVSIMGKYLALLLFPITLTYDYSFNTIPAVSFTSYKAFLPLLIYMALIVYAFKTFKEKNPVSFGILFFIITISIVSNILFLIESTMAERFLYMPSLGFCIAIVFGMMKLVKQKGAQKIYQHPVILLFFIVIILYSGKTISRNADWKTNLTLIEKDIKSSPESGRLHYAYGSMILFEQAIKEKDQAKKMELITKAKNELEKAATLMDNFSTAWYNLGVAYKQLGETQNAIVAFRKSKSFAFKTNPEGYIAEALAQSMENKYDSAIANMQKALEIDPVGAADEALNAIATYYGILDKPNKAIESLNKLIEINPRSPLPYYNLGNTYAKTGDYKTAVVYYSRAISIHPAYVDAMNNIGNCYSAMQMPDSAKIFYQKAVETEPTDINSLKNMGVFYRQSGDTAQAELWFNKAKAAGAN